MRLPAPPYVAPASSMIYLPSEDLCPSSSRLEKLK